MKLKCRNIFIAIALLMLVSGSTVGAATNWTTDAVTGAKIGWVMGDNALSEVSWSGPVTNGKAEGKGTLLAIVRDKDGKVVSRWTGEVEMIAGLLDGKGILSWANGDSYDGDFKAGLQDGKGVYSWTNGAMLAGEFKNGLPNGIGIQKDPSGKVIYEGEWKDGKKVASLAKFDKILGISWGMTESEAAKIMNERPKTRCQPFVTNAVDKVKGCYSTFNGENVFIQLGFYQGKTYYVWIVTYVGEDGVMEKFSAIKQGMSERYGPPALESGKYLDNSVWWNLNEASKARLKIAKNTNKPNQWPESQFFSQPFALLLMYYHFETDSIVEKAAKTNSGNEF